MKKLLVLAIVYLVMIGCNKDEVPELSTIPVVNNNTFATTGGIISSDGGSNVTLRGVCWSTSPNPTVDNDTTIDGSGTGSFSSIINVEIDNIYYVRAYATNNNGTGYGNELTLNTFIYGCTDSLAINYNPNASVDDGSCRYFPIIGDSYQGGIVFYLDGNGGGLIAYPTVICYAPGGPSSGLGGMPWTFGSCNWQLVPGADGTAVGTGFQNTIDLLASCQNSGGALTVCNNLVHEGYDDWFFPSIGELELIHENIGNGNALGLGNLGPFGGNVWSSTQDTTDQGAMTGNDAYYMNLNHLGISDCNKINELCVIPIRAF